MFILINALCKVTNAFPALPGPSHPSTQAHVYHALPAHHLPLHRPRAFHARSVASPCSHCTWILQAFTAVFRPEHTPHHHAQLLAQFALLATLALLPPHFARLALQARRHISLLLGNALRASLVRTPEADAVLKTHLLDKTKQHKTMQNKTKQNKTKQNNKNKTKRDET